MKKQTILAQHLAEAMNQESLEIRPKSSINFVFKKSITQCAIADSGIVLNYDLAGDERFTYSELENKNKVQYLGTGMIYRVNEVVQHMNPFKPKQHFWVWEKQYENIEESINNS